VASMVKTSVDDELLFEGLGNEFEVGRYHSWVVDTDLPDVLEATSFDENGQVMSLRHKTYDVRGVQFHPESVLTPNGKKILENWVKS
jgi:anthranilate synthase component 2